MLELIELGMLDTGGLDGEINADCGTIDLYWGLDFVWAHRVA